MSAMRRSARSLGVSRGFLDWSCVTRVCRRTSARTLTNWAWRSWSSVFFWSAVFWARMRFLSRICTLRLLSAISPRHFSISIWRSRCSWGFVKRCTLPWITEELM